MLEYIQKRNAFDIHSSLLNLRFNPIPDIPPAVEKMLWIYVKLYVACCIALSLYALGRVIQ